MKYYPAVIDNGSIAAATALGPRRILMSYHYFKSKQKLIQGEVQKGTDIFLDSGAFSAMNLSTHIVILLY